MLLLEVIVQSVEDARAAAAGGADRLEVVREIERGGLTPSVDLVRALLAETGLPLRVMVRENDGFGLQAPAELGVLQRAAATLATLGVDGLVLGFARDGAVDRTVTEEVLAAAPGITATFHRAFDVLADPLGAIDVLRDMRGIDRVLTDGGGGSCAARCRRWQEYTVRGGAGLTVLAGVALDEETIEAIARDGCVREVHIGRAAREPAVPTAPVSAARVRRIRERASARRGDATGTT